jgi:hypothetical protein
MKSRFYLLILGLLVVAVSGLFSQGLVSKSPQYRNVVLEEYTGIHCGYCPQGHAIAEGMATQNPKRVVIINVHAGSYAIPGAGEPDFRTQFGDALVNAAKVSGFPAGSVNRIVFPGKYSPQSTGTALNRNGWQSAAADSILNNTYSPVNIGARTAFNKTTRELSVDVELYYTSNNPDNDKLNVVLLESGVIGPQSGGGATYNHKHILRHMLTGQWGEGVTPTKKGSLIKRSYKYKVDSKIVIENCNVAIFVTSSNNNNIYTGIELPYMTADLSLATEEIPFGAAAPGESVEKVYTIKNLTGSKLIAQVSASKSQRTPSDWTADVVLPSAIEKKSDNPQAGGTISINSGESADVTVKLTPGQTVGVGDAVIRVQETSPGNQVETSQMTAVSSNIEYIEITDDETIGANSSIINVVKSTGRTNFVQFDPTGFTQVSSFLNSLKIVLWSSGQSGGITGAEATAINDMLDRGVNLLISGSTPLSTLYGSNSNHPLFDALGVTWDIENGSQATKSFTIVGESSDKDFSSMYLPSALIDDVPLEPIKVSDANVASPILKLSGTKFYLGAKAETPLSKVIVLHFNPLVVTLGTNETKLIDAVLDWLEAPHSAGPQATLSTTELAFGEVKAGETKDMTVDVTNSGDKILDIKNIEIIGSNSFDFAVTGGVKTLAPGEKHTLTVKFLPPADITSTQDFEAMLEIVSNVAGETNHEVALKGTGIYKEPDGINDYSANLLQVRTTPNPAGSQAYITFELNGSNAAFVNASLIDATGRTAKSIYNDVMQPGTLNQSLNTAGLASGTYYLVVKSVYGNYNIQVIISK